MIFAQCPTNTNISRRHRIATMKIKVTNWPENEAGLRRRQSDSVDDRTLWMTEEALALW